MSTVLKRVFLSAILSGFLVLGYGGHLAMAGLIIDLAPNSSDSVKLSDLLDGTYDGITVEDKVFDEFVYSIIGDMPEAEEVLVLGFEDLEGNFGLTFHGVFVDQAGDGASDALLRFSVSVSEQAQLAGWSITDAHLFLGGVGVGQNSIFTVDESFEGHNNSMTVFSGNSNGQTEQIASAWTYFDSTVNKLRVTKDILAFTSDGTILPARATAIDQSFSQVQVPEPTTLSLLAMSLTGLLHVSRRRRR
ncbi:MAG: PEP-CTERM sorting domain-containing protein [Pirellulales bacterium]